MATVIKKTSPKPLPLPVKVAPTAPEETLEDETPEPEIPVKPVQLTAQKKAGPGPQPKAEKVLKEYSSNDGAELEPVPEKHCGKQAVASVSKIFKDGTISDHHENVGEVKMFTSPAANVGLTMAVTRNLGNFESVKMSVSLFMPCDATPAALQHTFDEVKDWVDTRVELLNQEVNSQLE